MNTTQHNTTPRIEYLDALRGFTMLLVVMTHVSGFALNASSGNYHQYFLQFRMPLFFFVSGFVFYKDNFKWTLNNIGTFLKKKIPVQIISPFIFLLCYTFFMNKSLIDALKSPTKIGYWFTFTLFQYFILYILLQKTFDLFKAKTSWRFATLGIIGFLLFNHIPNNFLFRMGFSLQELSLFGLPQMKYFIFFVSGTYIKKYFKQFEYAIDNTPLTTFAVATFFLINIFLDTSNINNHISRNISLLLSLCGIIIIFSLFRKNKDIFSSDNKISKSLKFIGKRTLDIYLIHYFFIPFNLYKTFSFFTENNQPLIEFAASLFITGLIIIACLTISSVLRINNTMAHYLFGAKK